MTGPDDLPRKDFEHLTPPPGAFDAMSGRARQLRFRRAGAVGGAGTLGVVAVAAALVLSGGSSDKQGLAVVDRPTPALTISDEPTAAPVPTVSPTPVATATEAVTSAPPSVAVTTSPSAVPTSFRGRAVDEQGRPVPGLYVLEVPSAPSTAGRTATDGTFTTGCAAPVLLSSEPDIVSSDAGPPVGNYAAQYVDNTTLSWRAATPPPCTATVEDVVVHPGGSLRGIAYDPQGQPFAAGTVLNGVALVFANNRNYTLDWSLRITVGAGGRFEVTGIPTGVTVHVMGDLTDYRFTVAPRQVIDRSLYYCSGCTGLQPAPASTPTA